MTLMRLDERGLTLAEILVAVMIAGIGLVGVLSVIPVSSYALTEGKQLSTATFLGAQRLEQARNAPWVGSPANDCLGLGPSAAPTVPAGGSCTNGALTIAAGGATFADEANVPGYPGYGRTLRITSCATGCAGITDANLRMVTVNVTYTPLTGPSKTTSMTKLTSRR